MKIEIKIQIHQRTMLPHEKKKKEKQTRYYFRYLFGLSFSYGAISSLCLSDHFYIFCKIIKSMRQTHQRLTKPNHEEHNLTLYNETLINGLHFTFYHQQPEFMTSLVYQSLFCFLNKCVKHHRLTSLLEKTSNALKSTLEKKTGHNSQEITSLLLRKLIIIITRITSTHVVVIMIRVFHS